MIYKKLISIIYACVIVVLCVCCTHKTSQGISHSPRIINIINFIRQTDYRVPNADSLLFETVEKQVELVNKYHLPATFLLQYDALIQAEYQDLLKKKLNDSSEIGGWFEITQPQVEAAGMQWKGEHSWVSHANMAFSTGYTQEERIKLVDVYMNKFKEIFGYYPKSMGSWYIDAFTLNYMYTKYGIVASCNCKDQVGTDGYTLWGGYWNQAYYPSKQNGYMPAQTESGQIPVPVFRMLGSDPIYQYDDGLENERQGVISLEPVYREAGMNRDWVLSFLNSIVEQPCLAFNYAQAGQENSFTWEAMRKGLEMQIPILDSLRQLDKISIMTLSESGKWFRRQFPVTPATAVTALKDVRKEGNKTVWFNSRFYRTNLLWTDKEFYIRDIHLFDEKFKSDYYDTPGESSQFLFFTLPIVDGFYWSTHSDRAGLRIVKYISPTEKQAVVFNTPVISDDGNVLTISCKDKEEYSFKFILREKEIEINSIDDKNLNWGIELNVAKDIELPFTKFAPHRIEASFHNFNYQITCIRGEVSESMGCIFRIRPEKNKIIIDCTNGN